MYRVALVRFDVSETISPPSSWFLGVIGFHVCYHGITLHRRILLVVEEHYLLGCFHCGIN
jgi:hypothetical protein